MTETIRCWPGDALGNRFLLLREAEIEEMGASVGRLAEFYCAEVYDGLLLTFPEGGEVRSRVTVVNRDGSQGGTCLNGARLVARWTRQPRGVLRMDGRLVRFTMGAADQVTLHISAAELPNPNEIVERSCAGVSGDFVPFWNPHWLVEDMDDDALFDLGEAANEDTDTFPNGVNVHAVKQESDRIWNLRVYERGVGITESCGSAAMALCLKLWQGDAARRLTVAFEGGRMAMEQRTDGEVRQRGRALLGRPADIVASP